MLLWYSVVALLLTVFVVVVDECACAARCRLYGRPRLKTASLVGVMKSRERRRYFKVHRKTRPK